LRAYDWPGNVRELENLIERLAVLCDGHTVSVNELPDYIRANNAATNLTPEVSSIPDEGIDFNSLVNEFEVKLISLALEKTKGNKKAAAKLLNLNRTTLVEKIKKKGLAAAVEIIKTKNS
ncbi:MAG: sigma-54-dependent Fis family transcriptional regulator, partial [Candidatus Dadabacteria bacterium]